MTLVCVVTCQALIVASVTPFVICCVLVVGHIAITRLEFQDELPVFCIDLVSPKSHVILWERPVLTDIPP